MNYDKYEWLKDLSSEAARDAMLSLRHRYQTTGAVTIPDFVTERALASCLHEVKSKEDSAYTTDDSHTAYLVDADFQQFSVNSAFNHRMRTRVASVANDELPKDSVLSSLYRDPTMIQLVSFIVQKNLYLSVDPLGCCSVNVFRPGYYHAFHFDESDFSTTFMIQEAEGVSSGLFQYTDPLRDSKNGNDNLALREVASVIKEYKDDSTTKYPEFSELKENDGIAEPPSLHTLDFHPGTLAIFAGSKSLHRVTTVNGSRSRLVAVFTFSTVRNFCNSPAVQRLFWGRSSDDSNHIDHRLKQVKVES